MNPLKTMKIKDDQILEGYRIINQEDFDAKTHQPFEDQPSKIPEKTLAQLKEEALALGIKNTSKLNKSQLTEAIDNQPS